MALAFDRGGLEGVVADVVAGLVIGGYWCGGDQGQAVGARCARWRDRPWHRPR